MDGIVKLAVLALAILVFVAIVAALIVYPLLQVKGFKILRRRR